MFVVIVTAAVVVVVVVVHSFIHSDKYGYLPYKGPDPAQTAALVGYQMYTTRGRT